MLCSSCQQWVAMPSMCRPVAGGAGRKEAGQGGARDKQDQKGDPLFTMPLYDQLGKELALAEVRFEQSL